MLFVGLDGVDVWRPGTAVRWSGKRWVTDVTGGTMTVMKSAGPSADRSEVLIVDGQQLR